MLRATLLAALSLLAACAGTPAKIERTGQTGNDRPLTTWTFVAIDGVAPRSPRAELRIFEKRISATVGCNGLGGDLQIAEGRLKVGPIISTRMYCEGLMEQERAAAELLGASPAFFIENGRMAIRSSNHIVELVRKQD